MINKKIQKQFIKYLFIGGATAIFELILYTFLRKIVYLNLSLSNVIAVVMATLLNFTFNRGLAFKAASSFIRSFILYIILFALNTTFSTYAISLMVQWEIGDVIAKLITMGMITLWNFLLYRKVIFK
ncbi:GtrA family protein [Clostridium malenominatum]|uniref:GtrA family protein n=1 Tax=Clostridium malenominatum TaxID=1539 RepID=A0ABP3UCZ5_9CLOT